MAILFGVQPWQMQRLPALRRAWYEQVAIRHREREQERWQALVDVLGEMLGGH